MSERPRFEFVIGSGKCLQGFEQAVRSLSQSNPTASFLLKSPYGKRGMPPNIPGDTDLAFNVTLLEVDGTDAASLT